MNPSSCGEGVPSEATAGEPALATSVWGILNADDAGGLSQLPVQVRKMMGMIVVVVYAAFSLTISEVNTEIMCLRSKKGIPESTIAPY